MCILHPLLKEKTNTCRSGVMRILRHQQNSPQMRKVLARRILETGDRSELGITKLPQDVAHVKVEGAAGHHVWMMTLVSAPNCVFSCVGLDSVCVYVCVCVCVCVCFVCACGLKINFILERSVFFNNQLNKQSKVYHYVVPAGLPSHGGDVMVYV